MVSSEQLEESSFTSGNEGVVAVVLVLVEERDGAGWREAVAELAVSSGQRYTSIGPFWLFNQICMFYRVGATLSHSYK